MTDELPPFLRAQVDQQEAELRNLLNNAMDQYREHAEQDHDGEPNPCGQALVFLDQMGMMLDPERGQAVQAGPPLDRFLAYALIAYMVERLYVKEREMARAAAEILTVTQELKALKAKFEAGR
ncbi:hypothetical protein [Mycolicibacterium mageritense]|uniref:hypothetical protein n=1 Tax=Mycolicibacterium mageritense TaxID=53462 RepID=UPI001E2BE7EC|nr:hypothetical protein [Mycolicibacterium mageritense]GJJ23700.1 hypothetical protein MTY414_73730 [Mycolicibacterium mageritense]